MSQTIQHGSTASAAALRYVPWNMYTVHCIREENGHHVCACVYVRVLSLVGLVFDESQPPDKTLQPAKQKPKVTLIEDPKQSQVDNVHVHNT